MSRLAKISAWVCLCRCRSYLTVTEYACHLAAHYGSGGRKLPNTIALVDDDRNILTSVSMALEAEGFFVRCYNDGAEALKGLSTQPVDIAVLDIKMPRMDGMELLAQLRRHSNIPIIFLTSKDDEVDELLGLRMGADDYIKKPFSQRLLIERIRTLIRREELARERDNAQGEPVIVRGQLIPDPASVHVERPTGRADRDRISDSKIACAPARPRQKPRPADGCRLWRAYLCRRSDDRQPHQAPAKEIQ